MKLEVPKDIKKNFLTTVRIRIVGPTRVESENIEIVRVIIGRRCAKYQQAFTNQACLNRALRFIRELQK